MSDIVFKYNKQKSDLNYKKHKVSFEEAKSVFYDDFTVEFFDEEHSDDEDRFILLGMSEKYRILVVCHYYRESDSVIRIISSSKATKEESKFYRR